MGTAIIDRTLLQLKSLFGFEHMSERERLALLVGVVFVLGVLLYQFIASPYLDARNRLQNSLARKQVELTEIQRLSEEYSGLRVEEVGLKERLKKRDAGFTLFAFLDRQAQAAGVKEKIKYMKPSIIEGENGLNESVVEMRLEGTTLDRLVEFLRLTESDTELVSVRRLSIQNSTKDEGYLDIVLQIVTLVEVE